MSGQGEGEGQGAPSRPWHYLLLVVPFVWQVVLLPWANDVRLAPFGIPFAMLWQMAGIVVATVAIGLTYRIDRRRSRR